MQNFYEKLDDKFKVKTYNPNKGKSHHIELPMRACIIGASGSGKTNCVLNLLRVLSNPKPTLSHVYLCCKDKNEPLYSMLEDKLGDNITIFTEGKVPLLSELQKDGEQLIIFDDLVGDKQANVNVSEYYKMARKKNISCVYISQSYYRIDKFIRSNCSYLIIKKVNSKRDLKLILSEYPLDIDVNQLTNIYNNVTKRFEDVMTIDLLHGSIYHNFISKLI